MGERCAQDQAEQMGAGRVLVTCPLRMLLVSAHESTSLHRLTLLLLRRHCVHLRVTSFRSGPSSRQL